VTVEEISASEWADKVYRLDIVSKPDQIYKKPGYSM
jgi:4-oxalocrotonate tautomerase